jgi:hypothetical protein
LVEGAIALSRELGVDAVKAATACAQACLDAAFEISAAAGLKVRDALGGAIGGIKLVLKEPFKSHR